MKAAVIREYGDASVFALEDVADPVAGPGEVVVDLRAASVNRRDRGIRAGSLVPRAIGGQSEQPPTFPLILGSDGAGVVSELGSGVGGVAVGDEVVINPSLNWGESDESPGPDWETLGVPRQGTYAERIAVPAAFVAPKPPRLTWCEAAVVPLAGLTAWRAVVTKARVAAGERVLVPGVGSGVATFVLQFAHAFGCEVVVTSSSEGKLARAQDLGAAGGHLYTDTDWPARVGAFDVVIDSIGEPIWSALGALLRPGGRMVSYGRTARLRSFTRDRQVLPCAVDVPRNGQRQSGRVRGHDRASGCVRMAAGDRFRIRTRGDLPGPRTARGPRALWKDRNRDRLLTSELKSDGHRRRSLCVAQAKPAGRRSFQRRRAVSTSAFRRASLAVPDRWSITTAPA